MMVGGRGQAACPGVQRSGTPDGLCSHRPPSIALPLRAGGAQHLLPV